MRYPAVSLTHEVQEIYMYLLEHSIGAIEHQPGAQEYLQRYLWLSCDLHQITFVATKYSWSKFRLLAFDDLLTQPGTIWLEYA